MELFGQIISLVRSVVTGENPVAMVLGILCIYLGYQIRIGRKEFRELRGKNEQLHERIEKYLESGWHAQLAERTQGDGALREAAGDKKGSQ